MRGRAFVLLAIFALIAAGCDALFGPPPTSIPEVPTVIPASPITRPIVPTLATSDANLTNIQQYTPGSVPVGTDTRFTPTPLTGQSRSSAPMSFTADDGLILVATYYAVDLSPAPVVMLLPGIGSRRDSWAPLAASLQAAGYSALALDLRGQGETGGPPNWTQAPQDVALVLGRLAALPGVDPKRISVVGASLGANLAIVGCAASGTCRSVVLLSPSLEDHGVKTADALASYGAHPVLIVASTDDHPSGPDSAALLKLAQDDPQAITFAGTARGMDLFTNRPALAGQIVAWLKVH